VDYGAVRLTGAAGNLFKAFKSLEPTRSQVSKVTLRRPGEARLGMASFEADGVRADLRATVTSSSSCSVRKEESMSQNLGENALEHRARRAARRTGLIARKSRRRANSLDNLGGFMLVDPMTNFVVDGSRYDLSAEYVIDYCSAVE
jgi:hypothetical protein